MSDSHPAPLVLTLAELRAEISAGELTSFRRGEHEFMHSPDEPGWGHSDTEMFPVVGPTAEIGYRVQVPRGNALQDQHGLLREMPYSLVSVTPATAILEKTYKAGTPVANSKYPKRSSARWLVWPYSFRFEKRFTLRPDALEVAFEVTGDVDMPFMIGYHPAFNLQSADARVTGCGRVASLAEVLAVGDRALEMAGCETLVLEDTRRLELRSTGFGHFMLWTPDPGMICIEPVTYYPGSRPQAEMHEGFQYLERAPRHFSLTLTPLS